MEARVAKNLEYMGVQSEQGGLVCWVPSCFINTFWEKNLNTVAHDDWDADKRMTGISYCSWSKALSHILIY